MPPLSGLRALFHINCSESKSIKGISYQLYTEQAVLSYQYILNRWAVQLTFPLSTNTTLSSTSCPLTSRFLSAWLGMAYISSATQNNSYVHIRCYDILDVMIYLLVMYILDVMIYLRLNTILQTLYIPAVT